MIANCVVYLPPPLIPKTAIVNSWASSVIIVENFLTTHKITILFCINLLLDKLSFGLDSLDSTE